MLAYPDVQMLDVMGPLEVFSRTSRWLRDNGKRDHDAYSIEIIGLKRGVFRKCLCSENVLQFSMISG